MKIIYASTDIGDMRKVTLVLFLIIVASSVYASNFVVQNSEDGVLYYIVADPQGRTLDAILRNPDILAEEIKKRSDMLEYLPPHGAIPISEENPGTQLLVGFYVYPGSDRYPMVAAEIPYTFYRTAYTVTKNDIVLSRNGAVFHLRDLNIEEIKNGIVLDNQYLDWIKVPDLLHFSENYNPIVFSREKNAQQKSYKIEESLYWKKGGTPIENIKATYTGENAYFMISSFSEMNDATSYFFYIYRNRMEQDSGRFTVELPIAEDFGYILLWSFEKDTPDVIGVFTRSNFYLEGRIFYSLLPWDIGDADLENVSIDITSCYFNSDLYEEFFFNTIFIRDIIPLDDS